MKLNDIFNEIQENKILLPDFQRDFVWEEESQKKLIASIITKLPIGSVLMLDGDSKEFSAKKIGKRETLVPDSDRDVNFLLDGQQRITTLHNAFSSEILLSALGPNEGWGRSLYNDLKYRYFFRFQIKDNRQLEIVDLEDCIIEQDIFGLSKFSFPTSSIPLYRSSQVFVNIISKKIEKAHNINSPFWPEKKVLSTNESIIDRDALIAFCLDVEAHEGVLLPLYLLRDNPDLFNEILEKIANVHMENIKKLAKKDKEVAINYIGVTGPEMVDFEMQLIRQKGKWVKSMFSYFNEVTIDTDVNLIQIDKGNRNRAIDIYENLNISGVSLTIFDLLIARVATVDKGAEGNFKEKILRLLKMEPDFLNKDGESWNAVEYFDVLSKDDSIQSIVKDTLINMLLLVNKIKEPKNLTSETYKTDIFKSADVLDIDPKVIVENYPSIICAMTKAMKFLQYRCGVININGISYNNIFLIISYYLLDKNIISNENCLDMIEGWYWSVIFSGKYDSDQNSQRDKDFKQLHDLLYTTTDDVKGIAMNYIRDNVSKCFGDKEFVYGSEGYEHLSDEGFTSLRKLMLENNYNLPKINLRMLISQYVLSNNPKNLLKDNLSSNEEPTKLTAKSHYNDRDSYLELHHIIPLKSDDKNRFETISYEKATKEIRNQNNNILNSPLNFTYIPRKTNNTISNETINKYFAYVSASAKMDHCIYKMDSQQDVKSALADRYVTLGIKICNEIELLTKLK